MSFSNARSFPIVGLFLCSIVFAGATPKLNAAETDVAKGDSNLELQLSHQVPLKNRNDRFHRVERSVEWSANETALILCDFWDSHHSINAVHRVNEMAPRLNQVIQEARRRGVTIIHAPSDCMPAYANHAARIRAQGVPGSKKPPIGIARWCSQIPSEEASMYPIDQTDGGEDDDPQEHAAWVKQLEAEGRNPGTPWLRQHPQIEINEELDFISDRGDEIWTILEDRGLKHVILAGVHTNMCVLGRPFGLRQMARTGKEVVLMRDMTDTMYNPSRWPFVNHFTGTDYIVDHVERFVCPTISSVQFLGGAEFRFENDKRPHIVMLMGENLYDTTTTLPEFAKANLGRVYRVSTVYADAEDGNLFPGAEVVGTADLLIVSVRRRAMLDRHLALIRQHVKDGKPILGLRTASHAFDTRGKVQQDSLAEWPTFDGDVWGGSYHGHYPDSLSSVVEVNSPEADHPILKGISEQGFPQGGSLYQPSPVASTTNVLLWGIAEGKEREPVAWINKRTDGGTSFYTSLGHPDDFQEHQFLRLLDNAVAFLLDREASPNVQTVRELLSLRPWQRVQMHDTGLADVRVEANPQSAIWLRCACRFPDDASESGMVFSIPGVSNAQVWLDGSELQSLSKAGNNEMRFQLTAEQLQAEETHLLVIKLPIQVALTGSPRVRRDGDDSWLELTGNWELRLGNDSELSKIPLPAKFGTGSDIYIEPKPLR